MEKEDLVPSGQEELDGRSPPGELPEAPALSPSDAKALFEELDRLRAEVARLRSPVPSVERQLETFEEHLARAREWPAIDTLVPSDQGGRFHAVRVISLSSRTAASFDSEGHRDFFLLAPGDIAALIALARRLAVALDEAVEGEEVMLAHVDPVALERWGLHEYPERGRAALGAAPPAPGRRPTAPAGR